jgi:hypothetical protein
MLLSNMSEYRKGVCHPECVCAFKLKPNTSSTKAAWAYDILDALMANNPTAWRAMG